MRADKRKVLSAACFAAAVLVSGVVATAAKAAAARPGPASFPCDDANPTWTISRLPDGTIRRP